MSLLNIHKNRSLTLNPGPGGQVWSEAGWDDCIRDPAFGYGVVDLAIEGTKLAPSGAALANGLVGRSVAYLDDGCTINPVAQSIRGGMVLTTDATDNDQVVEGGGFGAPYVIGEGSGIPSKLFFGARIKTDSIADSKGGVFVGLAEESLVAAADALLADDGSLADKDLIGFWRREADGDAIDFVYKKAGQTLQVVIADMVTIAADTEVQLEFVYDLSAPATKRIKAFVNNVEQNTYITKAMIDAATFPKGEELQWYFGLKNGAAEARNATRKFLYVIQHT